MKNVACFFKFSAIATQRLKKQTGKRKPNEDHEDSRYDPLCYVLSTMSAKSNQKTENTTEQKHAVCSVS